jgi:multiple sugar transport system substrate-binding protein
MLVQFDSPETVAAFEWLAETYDRNGKYAAMLPPGVESWTDTSNNEAFLAGQLGYTHNAFSVYAQAKRDNNPVYPNITLLPAPTANNGDSRDGGNVGGWLTIFKGAPNVDLAKKLALHLLDPVNFGQISALGGVLFTPAYANLWTDELLASDPNLAIIKEQVSVTDPFLGQSWPANPNAGVDAIRAQGVLEQGVANVISGRMAPADAVKDAHQKMVDIFEEGGMMQS